MSPFVPADRGVYRCSSAPKRLLSDLILDNCGLRGSPSASLSGCWTLRHAIELDYDAIRRMTGCFSVQFVRPAFTADPSVG